MFRLFGRSRRIPSSARTPAFVEGLEGRTLMSIAPLNPGSDAALLPAVHTADVPAVQHGLLLPAVHTTVAPATVGSPAPTGYLIGLL